VDVLIVTWHAGGGSQMALGLGRVLAAAGHRVRILAPASYAERIAAIGCEPRAFPPAAEFDPAQGRAMEDQGAFFVETLHGPVLPAAVAALLDAEPADVVVVDCLLRAVACLVESRPEPSVLLFHLLHRFHGATAGDGSGPWGWRTLVERVNALRAGRGLAPLPLGTESVNVALARAASGALVGLPRELDTWDDPPPGVSHVGPLAEEAPAVARFASPWPAADRRPLVVVSLGTQYLHQEDLLRRVARALDGLGARVLVLTGRELDPAELGVSDAGDVVVRGYVPHAAVLGEAALVVTHAGTGTLVAAFGAGVPALCLPLGRDQAANAARAAELDAAVVVDREASEAAIREAAAAALAAAGLRAGAARLAAAIARYDDAGVVAALERIVSSAPAAR
jgi:MGT family glycosyltransferase